MSQDDMPVSPHIEEDEHENARRLGIQAPAFDERALHSLVLLRRRWRQAPDVRDVALEERRLKFARWLVEHGWLSEDDGISALDHACGHSTPGIGARQAVVPELSRGGENNLHGAKLHDRANGEYVADSQPPAPRARGTRVRERLRRLWSGTCKVAAWLFVPAAVCSECQEPFPGRYPYYPPYPPFH